MPFLQTCRVEERVRMMLDYDTGNWSVSDLCQRYRVCRDTFYEWRKRRDSGERGWFMDHSHAARPADHRQARPAGPQPPLPLKRADKSFQNVLENAPDKLINCANVPKQIGHSPVSALEILHDYNIPPPKTASDLAGIAHGQIAKLESVVKTLTFDNAPDARERLLRVNDSPHQAFAIGIAISALTDTLH